MPRPIQRILFGAFASLALSFASASAQPTVTAVTPAAVRVGEATEIVVTGDNLAGPLQLTATFPSQTEIVSQEAQRVVCRVTVPADAMPQVGAVYACRPEGATDPLWIVIDDLPTVADSGANHQLSAAQEVVFGCGIDGAADGIEADYYRVQLAAGQRLAAEVLASRWGSACDPVVRLLNVDGTELLAADDIEGLGGDCHLEYVAKQDGPVVIEVRDNKYQSAVRYRLRIGDLALAHISDPLAMQRGSTALLSMPTAHPDQSFTTVYSATAAPWLTRAPLNARATAAGGASIGVIVISDFAEYRETEPNNENGVLNQIPVPSGITGVISDPLDRDVYSFAAKAGQQLVFRTTARSVGSPAFPLLRIANQDGQVLAESAYGDGEEITLPFAVPADGQYQLQVDELTQRGGPQFVYRVELGELPFRLALKNVAESHFRLAAPTRDGAATVDLQCERFGYNGPIQLSVEPAVSGIELFQSTIPEGAAEHRLYIAFNEKISVGTLQSLRIVGRATIGQKQFSSPASTAFQLRTRWPGITPLPPGHDGLFVLSATPEAAPILRSNTDATSLFVPRSGGTAQFVVTAERLNAEFKDPLAPVNAQLPAGISAAIAPEGDKFTITLTSAATSNSATHPISFGLYGAFSGRPQLARVTLPLEINDPLSVADAAVQIKAGTIEKLRVQLVRRGNDRQPVTLAIQNLPTGITITEATLPADQDVIELDVMAAAEAPAGTYATAQIVAQGQYAGQPTSATGKLTITVPAP